MIGVHVNLIYHIALCKFQGSSSIATASQSPSLVTNQQPLDSSSTSEDYLPDLHVPTNTRESAIILYDPDCNDHELQSVIRESLISTE